MKTAKQLEQLVVRLIVETFNRHHPEEIDTRSDLQDDLGLDSVMMLHLIVEIELTTGLEIPDECLSVENLKTVQSLVQLMEERQMEEIK
ncbi:acyl carrier protein [Jeotgalibacillus aurantiacus]|uniref:acyl carrier protein n=1 Tax=Jeotgalibacillus aurantiacus TaxID=2763266 RepID=UPI001D0B2FB2|nr:phosphopantetheine-binding protein [Jeotgalibacillus aurantiacus]